MTSQFSTDKNEMDVIAIHIFLSNHLGWSDNNIFEKVQTFIDNSLNFGLFYKGNKIGFARVISDFSAISYLGDGCHCENDKLTK